MGPTTRKVNSLANQGTKAAAKPRTNLRAELSRFKGCLEPGKSRGPSFKLNSQSQAALGNCIKEGASDPRHKDALKLKEAQDFLEGKEKSQSVYFAGVVTALTASISFWSVSVMGFSQGNVVKVAIATGVSALLAVASAKLRHRNLKSQFLDSLSNILNIEEENAPQKRIALPE